MQLLVALRLRRSAPLLLPLPRHRRPRANIRAHRRLRRSLSRVTVRCRLTRARTPAPARTPQRRHHRADRLIRMPAPARRAIPVRPARSTPPIATVARARRATTARAWRATRAVRVSAISATPVRCVSTPSQGAPRSTSSVLRVGGDILRA
jgi:hypothetical protein